MKRIYGLADPQDGVVRYVGQTGRLLCQRLGQHVENAKKNKGGNTGLRLWMRGLMAQGRRPVIVLLDQVPDERVDEAEQATIASYEGLFNVVTDGVHAPPRNWKCQPMAMPEGIEPLLGTMPDVALGARFGVSKYTVGRWRKARGIPSYAETTGDDGRIKVGEPHRRWTRA